MLSLAKILINRSIILLWPVIFLINTPKVIAGAEIDDLTLALSKNFICQFESLSKDVLNNSDTNSGGKFYFKAGGLMRFEYKIPNHDLIIINKNQVIIYDPELNNVTIGNVSKIPGIESFLFFQDPSKLRKLYKVVNNTNLKFIKAMTGQKLLFLKSYAENNPLSEIQLAYNSNTKTIEQLGFIDQQQNVRIFKFSEFEFPLDIVNEKFEFIIPKNAEVINQD